MIYRMAALPQVVNPLRPLGLRDGVELVLVSVEAWPDELMVRLRGFPSATTARLEAEHEQALGAWHDAGADGAPPYQPAERIFPEVSISDNVERRTRSVHLPAGEAARCSVPTTCSCPGRRSRRTWWSSPWGALIRLRSGSIRKGRART